MRARAGSAIARALTPIPAGHSGIGASVPAGFFFITVSAHTITVSADAITVFPDAITVLPDAITVSADAITISLDAITIPRSRRDSRQRMGIFSPERCQRL